jgi:hypothetical protein
MPCGRKRLKRPRRSHPTTCRQQLLKDVTMQYVPASGTNLFNYVSPYSNLGAAAYVPLHTIVCKERERREGVTACEAEHTNVRTWYTKRDTLNRIDDDNASAFERDHWFAGYSDYVFPQARCYVATNGVTRQRRACQEATCRPLFGDLEASMSAVGH